MFIAGAAHAGVIELQPKAGEPLQGLTPLEMNLFNEGRAAYLRGISPEEGLGPIFNKASCASCHTSPLGGWGNLAVTRFGFLDEDGNFSLWPGEEQSLFQNTAFSGCEEWLPMGAHTASRVTNSSLAFGLIEAIPDEDIAAGADPDDLNGDGIRGRVNWVEALEDIKGSPLRAGRFGWKAQVATVLTFSADAARNEMGLTNRLIPTETAPNGDLKLLAACDLVPDPEDIEDEDGFAFIDRVTHFQRYLGVPPQTPKAGMTGEVIFNAIGCAICHTPEWTTSDSLTLEDAIRGKTIRPYSNFLLHDIGDFADMIAQDGASEREMRTPVLWNLRNRESMMHNGSIAGDTFENRVTAVILAHGLFNEGAFVADNFQNLSTQDQAHLINFLGSLGQLEFDADGDEQITIVDAIMLKLFCLFETVTPDDECAIHDINQDGVIDMEDLHYFALAYYGDEPFADCNFNGQADIIDIILGLATDNNFDGIPDNCGCLADLDKDGSVNGADLALILGAWGVNPGSPSDLNLDGVVNGADIAIVLGAWGPCQ
ncbi:MAG: hypothetical protein KF724_04290 [Phycisphaeraceae bacterium]|nr:hypothetical protein [Phycisphaeraceae bacterium]